LSGDSLNHDFTVEGWQLSPGDEPNVETRSIQGDYFRTMQIPLLEGRTFGDGDTADSPPVVVVDQYFVDRYCPRSSPLGHQIRRGGPDSPPSRSSASWRRSTRSISAWRSTRRPIR
jgi:hypothetical protein